MAQHLDQFIERQQRYHELVSNAHALAQSKQKIEYDARHIDIEYDVGDQVLAWMPNRKNKLCYLWRGPYVIVEKRNPAAYVIRDAFDPHAKTRLESIRNIVKIVPVEQPLPLEVPLNRKSQRLIKNTFVIFRTKSWKRRGWRKELYVGEVYEDYDAEHDWNCIHHYADFGPKDDFRVYDRTHPLASLRLRPVFKDVNGRSFTDPKKKTSKSEPVINDYHDSEMDILVGNFHLAGNKIPPQVVKSAYRVLEERDRQERADARKKNP